MEKLISYFYSRGQIDESQKLCFINKTIIDQFTLFYRLGVLSEKFKNCPKRLLLIEELYREFSKHSRLQNYTNILLRNHYSHRLIRNILKEINYHILEAEHSSTENITSINWNKLTIFR